MKDYKLIAKTQRLEIPENELEQYIEANKGLSYPALRVIIFLLQLGIAGACIFFAASTQSWATIGLTTIAVLSTLCGLALLQPREFWRRNIKGFAIEVEQREDQATRQKGGVAHAEYALLYRIVLHQEHTLDTHSGRRHDIEHCTASNCMVGYIPLQGTWGYCGMASNFGSLRWLSVRNIRLQESRLVVDVKDANDVRINAIALYDLPGHLRAATTIGYIRWRNLLTSKSVPIEHLPVDTRPN